MQVSKTNKLKIFNDPIYGFISIPSELIYDLVQHRYFQRLRRISQMGLSYLVYPGAHHTRFHHALGCMHLMQKAVETLRQKGIKISSDEEQALYVAILLHDIGHGPFSHAMEHSIVNIHHEDISILFMNKLNQEFNGQLSLAIEIFKGNYPRNFFHQLISGQLDMDRMDYLKRDSFYSGVAEGNINSERLIQMLNVVDDNLVIDEKGIYSVEKFLVARRLMYWQAYLHKTSIVAEQMLMKALQRAKELTETGMTLPCGSAFSFFLENKIDQTNFDDSVLEKFSKLDDNDLVSALKEWQNTDDYVLSRLSQMILDRDLLKIEISTEKISKERITEFQTLLSQKETISAKDSKYFIFKGKISNKAYDKTSEPILILHKNDTTADLISASDKSYLKSLTEEVSKYYVCYPKVVRES
jgi:HD superfamily phosphohydrolase